MICRLFGHKWRPVRFFEVIMTDGKFSLFECFRCKRMKQIITSEGKIFAWDIKSIKINEYHK